MLWLLGLVVLVMAGGFVATMLIGNSKSNREENDDYSKRTGTKWARLSGIYAGCMVIVVVLFIVLVK